MSQPFEVTHGDFYEITVDEFGQEQKPTTTANISVTPEVYPDDLFYDAVLGRQGYHFTAALNPVVTIPGDKTIFEAESWKEDPDQRRRDIEQIAERIGRLLTTGNSIAMRQESPFRQEPEQEQRPL